MKTISQWRTVAAILALGVLLLVALVVCAQLPETFGVKLYESAAWSIVVLAVTVAGKASVQHLAGGGGVKGAIAALMTEAKPNDSNGA